MISAVENSFEWRFITDRRDRTSVQIYIAGKFYCLTLIRNASIDVIDEIRKLRSVFNKIITVAVDAFGQLLF